MGRTADKSKRFVKNSQMDRGSSKGAPKSSQTNMSAREMMTPSMQKSPSKK